ncbi:MAG TPA: T9SS type A sorting domain-containing protein [Bacteroidia bacterium]
MKNLFILLIVIASIGEKVKAQTNVYQPFPESNAMWCVSVCGAYSQTITGDTIVGGFTYHKLFQSGIYYPVGVGGGCEDAANGGTPYFSAGYAGAIRNDTAQRKVYFLLPSLTRDTLLCDFALVVGDTVKTYNTIGHSGSVVTVIDSILIGTKYRKRWIVNVPTICPSILNEQIIEGIGSTYGLLDQRVPYGLCAMYGTLVCFSQNNQTLYPTYSATIGCTQVTGIEQYNINNSISVYPNPASNHLTLTLSKGEGKASVSIYDVLGNEVISTKEKEIDVSALQEGVYTLSLITNAGVVNKRVVIVR